MTKIPNDLLRKISDAGFTIYMRNREDTYLYFASENGIGYLQMARFGGVALSTVHKPSSTTGTGFRVQDDLPEGQLTPTILANALCRAPSWVAGQDRTTVKKWKDFDEFRAQSTFHSEFRPINPND